MKAGAPSSPSPSPPQPPKKNPNWVIIAAIEAQLGLKHKPAAGIVFQPLATADFKQIAADTEELLRGSAKDTGTQVETADDQYGFRWIVLRDEEFEDLVVSVNVVSSQLEAGGYGDRLLCAVFVFEENGRAIYFIYNFKRGAMRSPTCTIEGRAARTGSPTGSR